MGLTDLEQVDVAAERKETVTRRHNNEKRLGAILALTLAKLSPTERTTLEFACWTRTFDESDVKHAPATAAGMPVTA